LSVEIIQYDCWLLVDFYLLIVVSFSLVVVFCFIHMSWFLLMGKISICDLRRFRRTVTIHRKDLTESNQ
jgi:hypothetical protein